MPVSYKKAKTTGRENEVKRHDSFTFMTGVKTKVVSFQKRC